ncbi:uncharacterized protein K452DRAFT_201073, partial [Aplosporella prunicola CBS 121167]
TVAAAPKKRRRRAPTTGATEDCFACRKRQVKCDRRRPYCTQCIDMGKECTGYRTTLTWGVGVASRGKLRGQSLPVPKSPSSPNSTTTREKAKSPTSNPATTTENKSPSPVRSPTVQDYHRAIDQTTSWHLPAFETYASSARSCRPPVSNRHLQRLHTSLAGSYDEAGLSATSGPLSSYSDGALSEYPSPTDFPGTPDDYSLADSVMHPYNEHYLHPRTPMSSTESLTYHDAPRSYPLMCEDLSSSISSDQSLQDLSDSSYSHSGYQDMFYPPGLATTGPNYVHIPGYSYSRGKQIPMEPPRENDGTCTEVTSALYDSIPRSILQSPSVQIPPRIRFLLDYYDKTICPVLVAFDGPSNPYRMHVLHLAMTSKGLQNAIAALAVNNIRMRQGTEAKLSSLDKGRRISNSAVLPDWVCSRFTTEEIREMHGEPTAEELQYKATSIELLNQQLADPSQAKDDSALATVLVLCLFHVCDSGFSKFRTQLAGVRKLLSMRDRGVQSSFIGWVEMFFTWFDVMTSTVNDREAQIKSDSFDILDFTADLGALEHLAGCEGRLFKLIARLGRLNLLSQNRPVRAKPENTPRPSTSNEHCSDYYSTSYDRLDGNGWGTPFGEVTQNPLDLPDDQRHEFWAEWHEITERLRQWELDPTSPPPMCDATAYALSPGQRDLLHISESFRYSALLYTERLAHPSLPSSSLNFQNLVAQALFHITQIEITSCVNKFLLWPLFIIGTECVDNTHRALVRQRCIEIQRESGFFNNLSGLEVLEKTWQDDDTGRAEELDDKGVGKQAFRWRKAMDRVDGEYILI